MSATAADTKHDTRCPYCGRFVPVDADGYYDRAERGGDQFDFIAAFCSETHADKFHGRTVQS